MSLQSPEEIASAVKPGASPEASALGASSAVRLNDRFDIWPNSRLSELDSPGATAFAVSDASTGRDRFFALVSDGQIVPRTSMMKPLLDIRCDELMTLVDWGTVTWPAEQAMGPECNRLIAIYGRPAGKKLIDDLAKLSPPMSEYDILRYVLPPAIKALSQLHEHKLTHRAIRPTNLFYRDATQQSIVFGDCAMSPPAYAQPAVFESLESAMASPLGRGPGEHSDDVFALGVTVLFLLLGRRPMPELDDEALLEARLASGSFAALVGKTPIPASLSDAMRGMLSDDPQRRWVAEDLEKWLIDRNRKPPRSILIQKSERPFHFEGRDYFNCRSLAHGIARHWRSTALGERKKELLNWIERGMGDVVRRDAVAKAFELPSVSVGSGAAILNARLAVALDPNAPLRFKSFDTVIDGIGPALTACLGDSAKTQELAEMVRAGLPETWLGFRRPDDRDLGDMIGLYRDIGEHLKNPRPGAGIERCFYELNPGQHCLSPLIEQQHVVSIQQLLPALEKIAPREGPPMDRHIAAFIADRLGGDVGRQIELAFMRDLLQAAVGLLDLYAMLQRKFGPAKLPNLTRWLATCSRPILASYHHRAIRKRMEAELPGTIKSGSVIKLQQFLVHSEQWKADAAGFAAAVNRYAKMASEIMFLQSGGASDPTRSQRYGQKFAAVCSAILAALAIVMITMVKV